MAWRDDSGDEHEPTPPRQQIPARADRSSPIVRMLERDFDPLDIEVAQRLRRDSSDPTLLIARLIRAIEHDKESSGDALQTQLGHAIKSQDKRLDKLELAAGVSRAKARWGQAFGGIALGIAASVAGFVIIRMLSGEELKGEYRMRFERADEIFKEIKSELTWIREHMKDKP